MITDDSCVLLFSGGRDSTIAAVRLAQHVRRLVLLTVTSTNMTGLQHVRSRINELKHLMAIDCRWILVSERPIFQRPANQDIGCISCHFGYFWIASRIADQVKSRSIACGFVRYQDQWVEQTPYAIERLNKALQQRNQRLHLPVADIQSREQAEAELRSYELSTDSLELKCHRQRVDPCLEGAALCSVVDSWTEFLQEMLASNIAPDLTVQETVVCGTGSS
jgi:hypothetical protein